MINAAVNIKFGSRDLFVTQNLGFVSQEGVCPPLKRHKTKGLRNLHFVRVVPGFCVADGGELAPPPPPATQNHLFASGCPSPRPFPLLCHTADMSAVSHGRHACCVTQQTRLLCHTADMSAVSHS